MNNFFDRLHITKLYQDHINYLNTPITPKKTEAVIKSFLTKKKSTTR